MAAVLAIVFQALSFFHGAPAVSPGAHDVSPDNVIYNFTSN